MITAYEHNAHRRETEILKFASLVGGVVALEAMQAEVVALHPLRDAGIVGHVFKLLPGNHLFLGAVCRVWKAAYAGAEDQQLRRASLDSHSTMLVTCGTESTLYSAVVAAPARARWAASCGLAMHKNKKLQLVAGLHADIETWLPCWSWACP